MTAMYTVRHWPRVLKRIAELIHRRAVTLAAGLERLGHRVEHDLFFDTIRVELSRGGAGQVVGQAARRKINVRMLGDTTIGVALGETTTEKDITDLWAAFNGGDDAGFGYDDVEGDADSRI